MKIGIIDFSSTAVSLLVSDIQGDMTENVINLRRSVSILDYLTDKGKLSDRGIEKVVDSVLFLMEAARKVGAEKVKMLSTASMRLISNYREVTAAIEASSGLRIEVLDGKAEAYTDYIANRGYSTLGSVLMLDVGGATAELADLEDGNMDNMYSLYIGPLALSRRYDDMYPDDDEARKLKKHIRKVLGKEGIYKGEKFSHIVLTGGNADALYRVYSDYYSLPEQTVRTMEKKKLSKLLKHLVSSSERSMLFIRNAPENVHVIIPAAILVNTVAKYFSSEDFIVSEAGVKEGYLRLIVEGMNG